jgi:hypothetical protein
MGIVGVIDYLLHRPALIIVAITRVLSAGGLALSHIISLLVTLPQAGFEGQLSIDFLLFPQSGEVEHLRGSPSVHYLADFAGSFFSH